MKEVDAICAAAQLLVRTSKAPGGGGRNKEEEKEEAGEMVVARLRANVCAARELVATSPLLAALAAEVRLHDVNSEDDDGEDVRAMFINLGIGLLNMLRAAFLRAAVVAAGTPREGIADLLSLSDAKVVGTLIECVVGFGILPLLVPELATHLHRRIGLHQARAVEPMIAVARSMDVATSAAALLPTLDALARCLLDHNGLGDIVRAKALADVLVGLVQVAHRSSSGDDEEPRTACASTSTPPAESESPLVSPNDSPRTAVDKLCKPAVGKPPPCPLSAAALELLDEIIDGAGDVTPVLQAMLAAGSAAKQAAPAWFRRGASEVMAQCLAKPGGVRALLLLMRVGTNNPAPTGRGPPAWKQVQVVAGMVASFPSKSRMDIDAYSKDIARQVLELLRLDSAPHTAPLIRAASVIMSRWLSRHPTFAHTHFVLPITAPLLAYLDPVPNTDDGDGDDDDDDDDGHTRPPAERVEDDSDSVPVTRPLVAEDALDRCITDLHALFVTGDPTAQLLPLLRPVALPLLRMHAVAQQTLSHHRRPIEEILVAYLSLLPELEAAAEFCRMILPANAGGEPDGHDAAAGAVPLFDGGPRVESHVDGALVVYGFETRSFAPGPTGGLEMRPPAAAAEHDLVRDAESALALLSAIPQRDTRQRVAADVFAVLVELYVNEQEADAAVEAAGGERPLSAALRMAVLTQVLVLACERHGGDVVADPPRAVHVVQLMLRGRSTEMVALSLQLLTAMLQGVDQLHRDDAKLLSGVLPLLEPLKTHEDPTVAEAAGDIAATIATRSPQWSVQSNDGGNNAGVLDSAAMDEIRRDLQDSLLPVRAHALGALRKFVLARDPAVNADDADSFLRMFEAQLEHSDSYLYLSAINGLVAMGDVYPRRTVPLLSRRFSSPAVRLEHRLKFGEALVQVARRCGEALPAYKDLFLPCLLSNARDPDALIRASSLACLDRVCELLRYALHGALHEVLACLEAVLRTDTHAEARRAAVTVHAGLLRGLGPGGTFDALGDALAPTVRLLRDIEDRDPDDVVRHHARVALGELNASVRAFMQPGRKMPAGVFLPSHVQ